MTKKKSLRIIVSLTLIVVMCCGLMVSSNAALSGEWQVRMRNWGLYVEGSNDEPVKVIQRYMLCYNRVTEYYAYNAGGVDGSFGQGTAAAVRAFQSYVGISIDGDVGDNTWTKMAETMSISESTVSQDDYYLGNPAIVHINENGKIWDFSTYTIEPYNDTGSGIIGFFYG